MLLSSKVMETENFPPMLGQCQSAESIQNRDFDQWLYVLPWCRSALINGVTELCSQPSSPSAAWAFQIYLGCRFSDRKWQKFTELWRDWWPLPPPPCPPAWCGNWQIKMHPPCGLWDLPQWCRGWRERGERSKGPLQWLQEVLAVTVYLLVSLLHPCCYINIMNCSQVHQMRFRWSLGALLPKQAKLGGTDASGKLRSLNRSTKLKLMKVGIHIWPWWPCY